MADPYVRLAEGDNVVVLTRHVDEGEVFAGLDGRPWTMPSYLEPGHKLAAHPIAAGEPILKYGFPIGTATRAIATGEHVHTHNVRSDWIPFETEESANGDRSTD